MKLKPKFYQRSTVKVAKDLIGKFLAHKVKGKIYKAEIIETEAYAGFEDKACHGSSGKTERNKAMFKAGGYAYVYIIYGIHHCLNITTGKKDKPSAVLIRGLDYPKADGPGKLCRQFEISKQTHNGISLTEDSLWLEDKKENPKIQSSKRVNIDYAGKCADWPWRFYKVNPL